MRGLIFGIAGLLLLASPVFCQVDTLVQEKQSAGYHQVIWNVDRQASGLYYYKIQAGDNTESGKMVLIE